MKQPTSFGMANMYSVGISYLHTVCFAENTILPHLYRVLLFPSSTLYSTKTVV